MFSLHFSFFILFTEGVSSPEAEKSPVIGNRENDSVTSTKSPSNSTGAPLSPSSPDHWPAQSDEDIDRLVAMHQNRSSLSSLGVNKKKKTISIFHFN